MKITAHWGKWGPWQQFMYARQRERPLLVGSHTIAKLQEVHTGRDGKGRPHLWGAGKHLFGLSVVGARSTKFYFSKQRALRTIRGLVP